MSTSGSRNFTVSRAEIIEEAVANIGALDPGNTLSAEEASRASLRLNLMIKGWMVRGANLWRREEVILLLQPNQKSYTFGVDNFARASEFVETTLLTAFSGGATSAYVSSASGIGVSDFVGIKLDDGTIWWPPAGAVTVNTGTGLLEFFSAAPSAASVGNAVYSYQYHGQTPSIGTNRGHDDSNPTKIAFAYRRDSQGTDTTVRIVSREEYSALSRKSSSGPVTEICHDRQLMGKVLVWPTNDDSVDQLVLVVDRVIEDFDSVANTPDFPVEWLNALMWGLSAELSNTYGLPIQERQWLKQNAVMEFEAANTFDVEEASVRFEYASQ